jgi:hypothetical protein
LSKIVRRSIYIGQPAINRDKIKGFKAEEL